MPIFEQLRAQGDLPCTYPLHVSSSFGTAFIRGGSRSTPLSPHAPHCHPASHWVSLAAILEQRHHRKYVNAWPFVCLAGHSKAPLWWIKPTERWKGHEPFFFLFQLFWGTLITFYFLFKWRGRVKGRCELAGRRRLQFCFCSFSFPSSVLTENDSSSENWYLFLFHFLIKNIFSLTSFPFATRVSIWMSGTWAFV